MMDSNILTELAGKYGTPLYVYDGDLIEERYNQFISSFDVEQLKVYYACKALSNSHILKIFKDLGAGLDCVSINEVNLGLRVGFAPKDIMYTPNMVSEEEYSEAIDLGVNVNVDNIPMLEYLGNHHIETPICIRINPHLMGGGNSKISVGHIDSKFGISIHQMPLVKRIVKNYNIPVEGIHVHTGSDIIDTDIFIRAANIIFSAVSEFESVTYIDFGSGFKVAYKEGDLATDIGAFGKKFSKVFNEYCKEKGKTYTLKFEPGKFLVSEAGTFLSKINQVKQTTSCTFAGINTGFNHLIRPMFYNAYHQVDNISNPEGSKKIYSIVGYICESDTFGIDRQLNEVRTGDILAFRNAGAYCFSMASNYNLRNRPAEVLVRQGKDKLIRRRQTLDDILREECE